MKHFRKSGGFTLVELVVSIAVASLVTMAATTVLMLALRVNRQTSDTATQQYMVRALLTAMEKAAMEGSIKSVKTDHLNYWELLDDGDEPTAIFRFSAFYRKIYVNDIPVLEDVQASSVSREGNLLNIILVTKEGSFDTSIYCRGSELKENNGESSEQPPVEETTVERFIRILASQYGSRGKIVYAVQPEGDAPEYYSEWYIGQTYENGVGQDGWNADTAWCTCYVSWALEQTGLPGPDDYQTKAEDGTPIAHGNWFSNVNDFMNFCQQEPAQYGQSWSKTPSIGNLVFFNIDNDTDADHIGIVVNVHGGAVYTIEGNNDGKVTLAKYDMDDPRILGYGRLAGLETE